MANVPPFNVIAPSVSTAAIGEPLRPAVPGPLTITTPPVTVNVPLLSIPSVSPFVGTLISNDPPETLIAGLELPLVAFIPSSVAYT